MIKIKANYLIIILISLVGLYSVYFIIDSKYNINSTSIKIHSVSSGNIVHDSLTKTIWQTAPKNPSRQASLYLEQWKNTPGWNYKFRSDSEVFDYLTKTFPSINITSLMLEKPILGYDLFRYSIVHDYGGYYADSDVEKNYKFDESMEKLKHCGVIIGTEVDVRNSPPDWITRFPRNFQLLQWTFYSQPSHPLLTLIIQRVVRQIEYYQIRNKSLATPDVMEVTGPGIWTDTIIDYIQARNNINLKDSVKCGEFYKIEDICILNVVGFARSAPHSDCKKLGEYNRKDDLVLSIHHFEGSWKNDN
ncbi:glycosyltransferase family 32 protein [Conidiobolus coronatus NRRL 28638]|uniref:Glycosyltransferase family 32 protein n=1 Tax=Conidiobolus coronatus (strain ATCC 28846 / CBS 209.66 / NRRL 28638) TaxID=796925 RepID=A0A137NYD4_CONC2|nr:glycosyltransferase family 32 protein [Conidiobolus coronatus NRRL 28638]|eukprot:KXN67681.1 glycosyltransferase family 32 protein [Conidiobolus coronatus NRRL 28638]